MFGVFSSVWSPDELAGMASVLCAEVCVKCFVCRALCNNEHNSAFALFGPRLLCTATHCFVCNDCRGVSRVHCSLCFVLTCKQWSVWCPICAICSVCSVGSGVFGGRLGMRRAEFPGARVSGGGAVCVPPYTVQSTVTEQYFTTLYCKGEGGQCQTTLCSALHHCTSTHCTAGCLRCSHFSSFSTTLLL